MTTTPKLGLTIPDVTDEIALIAGRVIAGITDVENTLYLDKDSRTQASAPTDWPFGVSVMDFSDTGWPAPGGLILNLHRMTSDATYQLCFSGSDQAQSLVVQVRQGDRAHPWTDWRIIGAPAEAAGRIVTAAPSGGGVSAVPITFPASRFSAKPRVQATAETTRPDLCSAAVSNITTAGCTIYLYRQDGLDTPVNWHAIQMDES